LVALRVSDGAAPPIVDVIVVDDPHAVTTAVK